MNIRFGCMDLMWGELKAPQFDAWLDEVKAIGFEGVGVRFMYTRQFLQKPTEFLAKLERCGLSLAAAYAPMDTSEADVRSLCALMKSAGCDNLVMHGYKRGGSTERTELARLLNARGEVTRQYGVVTMFHHHTHVPFENLTETEEQLAITDPAKVSLFCDTGHATKDFVEVPVAERAVTLLKNNWKRLKMIEFKDWSPETDLNTELCKGQCGFPAVAALMKERNYSGWVVLEQNSPSKGSTAGECARRSLEFATKLFN
ncbi:MAG TPA: TIM barrel protein [Planctomycetota bacterium]|nr:TIM barrel protein [Planctomycetota bacterium]